MLCGPAGTPGISNRPSPSVSVPVSASPSIRTRERGRGCPVALSRTSPWTVTSVVGAGGPGCCACAPFRLPSHCCAWDGLQPADIASAEPRLVAIIRRRPPAAQRRRQSAARRPALSLTGVPSLVRKSTHYCDGLQSGRESAPAKFHVHSSLAMVDPASLNLDRDTTEG